MAIFIADGQFLSGFIDGTYQSITRDELGVYHIGSKLFAHQAKSGVSDILHRSQKYRAFAQVYVAYFHLFTIFYSLFGCKSTEKTPTFAPHSFI
jgi:hypothetical protein